MKKRYWLAILCAVLALVLTIAAASADEGDVYGRMTDATDLHDGDRIILVSDDGSYYQAMATDFSGTQVTVTDNTIAEQDGMLALTLTETDGGWLLASNDGYLAADGGALTIVSDQADAAVWTISIASDGTATISCADGSIVFAEQDGVYRFFCGEGGNEIAIYNATFEAEQHPFGNNLWWSFANGKLTIGGSGQMPDFSYNSQPWNQLLSNITEVEIQDGVTSIGSYAFYYCRRLSEITIPDGVTSIGSSAFYFCTGLQSITIPDSVTSIGSQAFYGCTGLTAVTLGNGVTSISASAFYNTGWWNAQSDGVVYLDYILLRVKGTCGQIVRIKDGTRVIAEQAFYNISQITKVTIPDSVTSIGERSFYGCTGLTEITIPCSTSIGGNVFKNCTGITMVHLTKGTGIMMNYDRWKPNAYNSYDRTPWYAARENVLTITLDDGIQNIGDSAFYGCTGLTSITMPDSVTSIGDSAFYECTGLTSITIPDSVTSIGNYAFYGCTGLQSITIPDGVTSIGYEAFYGCTGLTEITIPDSVTSIGGAAFYGCTGLTEITIPDSITSIGGSAFYGCTGLTEITIPDSVTSIGGSAFYGCTGLTEITIPDSITSIGGSTFYGCTGLTEITIPDSVTSIGGSAFFGCTGLTEVTIPDSITSIGGSTFYGCTGLTSVTIGNSVTNIIDGAFSGCTSLSVITMPCSSNIYPNAFNDCIAITSVNLTKGTGNMTSYRMQGLFDDIRYNYYHDTPWYKSREHEVIIAFENGIQNIGDYAFYGCTGLTEITIPDSVTSIGDSAFYECTGLQSVTIGNGVTSIGEDAFSGCTGLTEITIPDSVTSIGWDAFNGCTGIKAITLPCSIDYSVYEDNIYRVGPFNGCTGLEIIHLTKGGRRMYDFKDSYPSEYFVNDFTRTPWYESRNNDMTIVIDEGVSNIGSSTFSHCSGIQSISLPSTVESIGKNAFLNCTGLTEITIPDSVTSIGNDAFSGCTGLQSITIGNGVASIGDYAFCCCTGLQSITIPDSVTSIGARAFSGCTGLTSITIGSGVTSIGGRAFNNCTGLTDVYYHGTRRMRNNITIEYDNDFLTSAKWHYLTPNAIEWKTLPDKLQYQEGESLDIAGGVFSAYYDYEIVEEETLTADMITGFDNTTAGEQTLTVTFEGKTLTYTVLVSHVPGEPMQENEVAPTCLADGEYDEVVYCSCCGEELSREHIDIPALGHDLVHHDAQAATCSEIGWEAYDTCSRCDYTTYDEIPALGHDLIHHEAQEPTCTEIGWEAYDTCSRCDYTTYDEIPALGHTPGEPVIENEVPPTYTEEGHYDEVVYCTRCSVELERHKHEIERLPFEGTVEWNPEDVKFKGTTAYVIANGSAQTPRFTVKNSADGSVVDPANYDYEYRENTNAGTGYVIVTFKGDYSGTAQGWFKIYLPATTKTNVENVAEGIRITWDPVEGADGYVIYRRAWSSTTNGWTTFERWNNTTDTTYIDGADANHKVYAGSRYQYGVKAYFARRTDPVSGATIGGNVGDNFNLGEVGPLKTTVRITTRVLNSVTAGSKQMTVKWTPSKNFTGYQIKYATDKNFTKNVVAIKITDPKTAQTVIKNLKKGTTYYVTIRSYHEFNGMTYFGEWSNVKSCKVK